MLDQAKFEELKSTGVLPSPKGAALKVIELCQRSNVSLSEIIHVIQADPGLTGRLLKMANAPVFARTRPVVSFTPDVLMSIGTQSLRQAVLAFSLVSANRTGKCRNFDYDNFWSRSIAMGVAAQHIGASVRVAPPVELFTCGLLAQIGRLALSSIHPERYGELLEALRNQPETAIADIEEQTFGLTHTQIAAAMMLDWGIPKLFADAVRFHEVPDASNFPEDSRSARLVWCLHLARRMADSCFLDDAERPAHFAILCPIAQKLGISPESLSVLGDQMLAEWREWSADLQIAAHDVTAFKSLKLDETVPFEPSKPQEEETGVTILIVDDDPAVLLMLKKLLTSAGHMVFTASNGKEAARLALEYQPRILITDWVMPEMNGLELVRTLRETRMGHGMYAIVMTVLSDKDNLIQAFDEGADDFIVKPIDPVILKARLKAGLRTIRVQQEIEQDREALRRMAAELTIAHQHAKETALTDSLTGLHNRRYAMERLGQEWAATERNRHPLSVMVLDIDHFKQVNDTYGHDVGDAALRHFAETLRELSRNPDVACRIGGEEFLVIATNTPLDGAVHYAERIRSSFEAKTFEIGSLSLKFTVSIGVAQKTKDITNLDQLLKRADDALYQAKHEGRNRVVAAPLA